jgi:hypothetical protein
MLTKTLEDKNTIAIEYLEVILRLLHKIEAIETDRGRRQIHHYSEMLDYCRDGIRKTILENMKIMAQNRDLRLQVLRAMELFVREKMSKARHGQMFVLDTKTDGRCTD